MQLKLTICTLTSHPVLSKFPNKIAPWKHGLGHRGRGGSHDFFYYLADEANKKPGREGSYAKTLFREAPKYDLQPREVSGLAGNLFGAGSDTSSSTLITAVLAMRAFPETLLPAWEELDKVVGMQRSPTFDDESNLPYVKAFVKEVFGGDL